MSPWNTDIFTYGRERPRGRKWVAQSIAAGDRFVVSSLGNTEETVRLGADPARIDRIVWYVDLRPFGPDEARPRGARGPVRLAGGFADRPLASQLP